MADTYTPPGSLFEKAMDNPETYARAKEADEKVGSNITDIYQRMKESRQKLDYMSAEDNARVSTVPEIGKQHPSMDSYIVGGDASTGPNPTKRDPFDTTDFANQNVKKFQDLDQLSTDPNQWAKPYTFNSGKNNADFDRYYTHPLYNKLGYVPWRDNESLYNEKSSWLDDYNRMRHQWLGMAYSAAKSMWYTDPDAADDSERAMTIANSSREGFGSHVTNFVANSAFGIGIAADIIVEDALAGIVTAELGGIGSLAAIPMLTNKARKAFALAQGVKDIKRTKDILDAGKSINTARTFYDSSKLVAGAAKVAGHLGIPMETAQAMYGMAKGVKGYDKLTTMGKAATTFGAFYRDAINIRAVYGEANMEGNNVKSEITDQLIGEYYDKHGKMPDGEDADRIYSHAKEAGFKDALYNIPLLMVTNNVVFGKALHGFKPKWLAKAEMMAEMPVETLFEKNWKKQGTKAFTKAPEGFKKFISPNYWKQKPTDILVGGLMYGKANFFEGAQESMQDMISNSMKDYYLNIYKDPLLAGSQQYWASMKTGAASQASGQGLETFLSGFLMGGFMQVPQNLVIKNLPKLGKNYAEHKAASDKQADALVDAMNEVVMNTGKFASAVESNLISQKNLATSMQNSQDVNDHKGYLDAKNASLFTHVHTLLRNGKYDVFMDAMESMREMNSTELANAMGTKPGEKINNKDIKDRLENSIQEVKDIKDTYESLSDRFVNTANTHRYNKKKEPLLWMEEQLKNEAYENARFHATFGHYTFNKTLSRMHSILDMVGSDKKPLASISPNDVTSLFNDEQRADRIRSLEGEIRAYKDGDASQKAIAKKLEKQRDHLVELSTTIEEYSKHIDETRDPIIGPLTKEDQDAKDERARTASGKLKNSYFKYMKTLASNANEAMLDQQVYPSLIGLQDYIQLGKEHVSMSKYVNFLHDPENFMTTVSRQLADMKKFNEERDEVMKEAAKEFKKKLAGNKVFNQIWDLGLMMDQSSIDALEEGRDDKIAFFQNHPPYGPVLPKTDLYKKATAIVEEYRKLHPIVVKPAAAPTAAAPTATTTTPAATAPVAPVAPVAKPLEMFTPGTPIADMDAALVKQLRDKYEKHIKDLEPSAIIPFEEYVKSMKAAGTVIHLYNQKTGRTIMPPATKAPTLPPLAPTPKVEIPEEVTPAEFKEVLRLAKFFVDDPHEPHSIGQADGRFPILYRKLYDIEERRQEELNQPKVILPIGTSGSGKSTWIKSLPKNQYIVISPDDMRVEFAGNINDKSKDKEIYEEVKKRTIQAVNNGKQVIIDTTNLQKERRRDFLNAVKSAIPNASLEYKLMELNPELAKQRIKTQIEKGENRANVPDSTIDRHTVLYKEMLKDIKDEPLTEFKTDKEINAKYDAELAALKQPEVEGITPGEIIYGTPAIGKSSLVKKYPEKYVSGDDIVAEVLLATADKYTEVADVIAKHGITDKKTQKSGLALHSLPTLIRAEVTAAIKMRFMKEKMSGRTVLTGNNFAADMADRAFVMDQTPDTIKRMAKEFKQRDIDAGLTPAVDSRYEADAETRLIEERRLLAGKPLTEVSPEESLEDAMVRAIDEAAAKPTKVLIKPISGKAIEDKIEEAEDLDDIKAIDKTIDDILNDPDKGIAYFLERGIEKQIPNYLNFLKEKLKEKQLDLARNTIIADLKKGDELVMKNTAFFGEKGWGVVTFVNSKQVHVAKVGDPSAVLKFKKSEIGDKIYQKVTPDMPIIPVAPVVITKEEKAVSDETVKVNKAITAEEKRKAIEDAAGKNIEDIENDLLDNLDCPTP